MGAGPDPVGLADLARLTGDRGGAHQRYEEALAILRVLGARPEIARCLAGLGRIAMDDGDLALGRRHLAESIELSRAIGNRIGSSGGWRALPPSRSGSSERTGRCSWPPRRRRCARRLTCRRDRRRGRNAT